MTECINCEVGYYAHKNTVNIDSVQVLCAICQKGTYSNKTASTSCENCDHGQTTPFIKANSSSHCEDYQVGEYESSGSCNDCLEGKYGNKTKAKYCYFCPDGFSTGSDVGSTSKDSCTAYGVSKFSGLGNIPHNYHYRKQCTLCGAGRYQNQEGSSVCPLCPSGKYQDDKLNANRTFCMRCPAGAKCCWQHDSDNCGIIANAGGTPVEENIAQCPVGRYGSRQDNCEGICAAGKYSGVSGATNSSACIDCPAGFNCDGFKTLSTGGSVYQGKKICTSGYFCPSGTASPVVCLPGTATDVRKGQKTSASCKSCIPGFHRSNDLVDGQRQVSCSICEPGTYAPLEGAVSCIACAKEDGCPEGGATCSEGYEQNHCGVCAEEYYEASGKCEKCTSSPVQTIIAILIFLLAYYFVSKIELNLHHIIGLKIYATFFQLMCLVMYVEVPWPSMVKQFSQFFYTLSFNTEVAHRECTFSFMFFDKLKMVVLVPIAIGALISITSKYFAYQKRAFEKANDVMKQRYYRKKWKALRQTLVIFVTSVYTPVCYYSLRMFAPCVETASGEIVMAGDTRLSCQSASYSFYSMFAWVALVVFAVGIPLGIVALVLYLNRKHQLNSGATLQRYGALYEWYSDEFAWFEAVSLARKG